MPVSAVEFRSDGLWNFSVSPQQTWGSVINDTSDHGILSPSTSTIPSNAGQKDAAQLVRSLESQVAFIEGDPKLQEDLELYYYRIVRIIYPFAVALPVTVTDHIIVWFYCNTVSCLIYIYIDSPSQAPSEVQG
jgi:hypothetical protein